MPAKSDWRVQAEEIAGSRGASFWIKGALAGALKRDPVDAANDAAWLAFILKARCDAILELKGRCARLVRRAEEWVPR